MGTAQYGALEDGPNYRPFIAIQLPDGSEITFVADKIYGPEQAQKVSEACFLILAGSHGISDLRRNPDPYGDK